MEMPKANKNIYRIDKGLNDKEKLVPICFDNSNEMMIEVINNSIQDKKKEIKHMTTL